MPTIGQIYFLNGPSFSTATSIFIDSSLSTCAPDGYYTDGIIVRQQVDCVLLPAEICPSCAGDCPITILHGESGYPLGVYKVSIDSGASIGAIVIRFNPNKHFNGFKATFNSLVYNSFSSTSDGYLSAPSGLATFVGNDDDVFPEGCQLDGETFVLDEYIYNGSTFDSTANTDTINVVASQNKLLPGFESDCYLVIPKTTATPSIINIEIYSTCIDGDFELDVSCPDMLPSFKASIKQDELTSPESCEIAINQDYFVSYVNGTTGALDLYDWVFKDQYGAIVLDDGYYRCDDIGSGDDTFRVENGVIVELLTICS